MTRLGPIPITSAVISAGIACLVAAACYAIAGIYIKRAVRQKNPVATATASQLTGAVMVALALPWASPSGPPTVLVAASLVALALLCSAFAYLLYFRLIERIGPSRALTVTFLSPGFGMLWASLALGESITLPMLAGCGLVVVGTGLVLRAAGSSNPNAQR